ncbi:MG2 domain-containing protein [Roseimaritima sediminicola]|uniref:MG2 domain-containing protein n=1 Tax=Roseimaritima sediminicola TaxID=2662066 RepID=UPI0012984EC4|nr:alpha-2-macroglobulin family protein [Roseimaritima sediminicola]
MNEMKQLLLELHYGLLEDAEAEALRERIERDPEVARLWAETLQVADRFASAARLVGTGQTDDTSNLDRLFADVKASPPPPERAPSSPVPLRRRSLVRHWRSFALAASLLTIICGIRLIGALPERPAAAMLLRAEPLTGQSDGPQSDATASGGASNAFRIATLATDRQTAASLADAPSSMAAGMPLTPASLTFSIFAKGALVYQERATTPGETAFRVPEDLIVPEGAHLEVRAAAGETTPALVHLPLQPTRCLTYLNTDRPVYRPGETIYFRSLTLNRKTFFGEYTLPVRYRLLDPAETAVPGTTIEGVTERGVGNGAVTLPEDIAGGTYTLVASSLDGVFPEERTTIEIRQYRLPRFKHELRFHQRSYGPDEPVRCDARLWRVEGEPLAGASVEATAVVDGEVIHRGRLRTDSQGHCQWRFSLPPFIDVGRGYVSIVVDDGGARETFSKTLPIQTGRVQFDFYPEGGFLVEGLRNRVYFSVRSSQGEPMHVEGEVMTRGGRRVARLQTTADGMGRFAFVPEPGQRYVVRLDKPLDVTTSAMLPPVVADRPVLDTGPGVFAADAPLDFVLRSTAEMAVRIEAVCRGVVVGRAETHLRSGTNRVRLPVGEGAEGVIRLTIFDAAAGRPVAERLVYRRSDGRLKVRVLESAALQQQTPGTPLRVTLQVTDQQDQPVAAVLGVAVVDQAALSLRAKPRASMTTHFLLTSEIERPEDLEHANFYLNDSPQTAAALDLLLGTQGWRRFVQRQSVDAESLDQMVQRLLELDGPPPAAITPVSNGRELAAQWTQYRTDLDRAWTHFLDELRWLLLPLFLLWALAGWLRARWSTVAAASLLVAVLGTVGVVGCGAPESASTAVMSQADEESGSEPPKATQGGAGEVLEPIDRPTADDAEQAPPEHSAATQPRSRRVEDPSATLTTGPADGAAAELSQQPAMTAEDLRRLLAARGIDAEGLAERLFEELRFPVRQYAHRHRPGTVRADFAETLYWHPMLSTDSQGRATIRFDLSDAATAFRIHADAHSSDGRIGSGEADVVTRLPLQIEPKLPLAVTAGDRIELPLAISNHVDRDLNAALSVRTGPGLSVDAGEATRALSLQAGQRQRWFVPIEVDEAAQNAEVPITVALQSQASAEGPALADTVRRSVRVISDGYPRRRSINVMLQQPQTVRLGVPPETIEGSVQITLRGYPSPLADLMAGVESVLAEPHGCFEQASAANYPNALALQYLAQPGVANPEVAQRASGMLQRGYQRLTQFECQQQGYEWFGADPGHEALSAFGLMQFWDMRQVMPVDPAMIQRTRQWLLDRRDGKGGWHRNPRHLHQWSVRQDVVNAYILWALSEADRDKPRQRPLADELSDELDRLQAVARDSEDAYLLALSAATLANVQRTSAAQQIATDLLAQQSSDGSLRGRSSVTQSGGKSLRVETTALAALAWTKLDGFETPCRRAVEWLVQNREGRGGFGSTQATVLALKALLAYGQQADTGGGTLYVRAGDVTLAEAALPDEAGQGGMIEIAGLAKRLQDHGLDPSTVELTIGTDQALRLPCTIDVAYHSPTPGTAEDAAVRLDVQMEASQDVPPGGVVAIDVQLENVTSEGQPMTVAAVGLPGGVEPRVEELNELREAGVIDFFELRPREVVFYWRNLPPEDVKEFRFHVTAEIPGRYTGPASRAYLYYTAEKVHWTPPLTVTIAREQP